MRVSVVRKVGRGVLTAPHLRERRGSSSTQLMSRSRTCRGAVRTPRPTFPSCIRALPFSAHFCDELGAKNRLTAQPHFVNLLS